MLRLCVEGCLALERCSLGHHSIFIDLQLALLKITSTPSTEMSTESVELVYLHSMQEPCDEVIRHPVCGVFVHMYDSVCACVRVRLCGGMRVFAHLRAFMRMR